MQHEQEATRPTRRGKHKQNARYDSAGVHVCLPELSWDSAVTAEANIRTPRTHLIGNSHSLLPFQS